MPLAILSPDAFTSAEAYHREQRAVFEASWVHVADVTDVPESGDYVPGALGGTPLLVMRGHDGQVRVFLNACPHRGAQLIDARGRCDKQLRCPYHAWSFASDGALRGVPHRDEFDCDLSDRNLVAVRSAILGPMIFACLDAGAPPFERWAGALPAAVAALGIDRWELAFEHRYEVAVNWKVYVENGLEGYHIPVVHDFLRDAIDLGSGENHLEDHGSYTLVQASPMLRPPDAPPDADATLRFGHLFPNLIPVLSPIDLTYLRIDPIGPDRVQLVGRGFDASREATLALPRELRSAAFDATNRQDIGVVERVQRGLRARGLPRSVHSNMREARVTHFEHMVAAALAR